MITKKQRKQSRFRNTHQVAHHSKVFIKLPGDGDYSGAASISLMAMLAKRFRKRQAR